MLRPVCLADPEGRLSRDVSKSRMPPLVTILMASYGRLHLLKSAVESALAQEYGNFEVLIIDDGSDEATKTWLRHSEMDHGRLRVLFQQHQGVAVARAFGVEEARGELICILDSDDTVVPHALKRLTDVFESRPDTTIVYTEINELRPTGAKIVRRFPRFSSARQMLRATFLRSRVPFKHSGTTFRRRDAIAIGSYDRRLPRKVDIDLYLKFLSAGHQPYLVREPLVNFRMHEDSLSINRMLGLRVWFQLIDRYGPRNPAMRGLLKAKRATAEFMKWFYIKMTGWRS
jgi:glycosyltransferase involved in cell wall biosynthesis